MSRIKNIINEIFGRLTVISLCKERSNSGKARWLCQCSCGSEVTVVGSDLLSGHTKSCGCLGQEPRVRDITGQKFGLLTVISLCEERSNAEKARWVCQCDCGNTPVVVGSSLMSGNTRSCGCFQREWVTKANTTHGECGSVEYRAWAQLKSRCLYKSNKRYEDYGGRGITVCERWLNSFENFFEDMGVRPEGLTLDRIENDGNYEPGNCRWADSETQGSNKRNSRLITYGGETLTHAQWGRRLGGGHSFVHNRLRLGWAEEDTVTVPVGQRRKSKP